MSKSRIKADVKSTRGGEMLSRLLLCVGVSVAIILLLSALGATLIDKGIIPLAASNTIALIIRVTGAIMSAFGATSLSKSKTMLNGILGGLCYYIVLIAIAVAAGTSLAGVFTCGLSVLAGVVIGAFLASRKGKSGNLAKGFR